MQILLKLLNYFIFIIIKYYTTELLLHFESVFSILKGKIIFLHLIILFCLLKFTLKNFNDVMDSPDHRAFLIIMDSFKSNTDFLLVIQTCLLNQLPNLLAGS